MISFPNGKINIGLQLTGKRPDGFHDLQTVFYPVAIKDVLEVIDDNSSLIFSSSGLHTGTTNTENLCVKAWHLLKKDFSTLPLVKIHLHKAIPVGAGLGGGSADAAACLQLLNTKFNLGLSDIQLAGYALQLGSDCPFFLINKPCYATGRGEHLEEIALDLSAYDMLLVNPGIHINTGWAFSQIKNFSSLIDLKKAVAQPIVQWKDTIFNGFEKVVFAAHPEIEKIKNELYDAGAMYAAMSGSGSSVYGIFNKSSNPLLSFPANYFSKWL